MKDNGCPHIAVILKMQWLTKMIAKNVNMEK